MNRAGDSGNLKRQVKQEMAAARKASRDFWRHDDVGGGNGNLELGLSLIEFGT